MPTRVPPSAPLQVQVKGPTYAYTLKAQCVPPQVQFHVKGPTGAAAVVHASMHQDEAKQWQYEMLYLDFTSPVPQRVMIVGQQH